ncbi:MAG: hypothetical protein HOG94_11190, partial [Nitrospinaceae bacterium]|nr:hypothetical protein [Nitrospinaceae bacterium]
RVSQEFDSETGNLTEDIIGHLNDWARTSEAFSDMGLKTQEPGGPQPREILLLDGSPNRLPLSAETARIINAHLTAQGLSIPIHVINRRDELMARVARAPRQTLVLSQTAQRSLYNARLAEVLVGMGAIVAPGPLTAPGGPLSNKEKTYEFLGGEEPTKGSEQAIKDEPKRMTARYRAVSVDGRVAVATADAILDTADQLREKWDNTTFFVKPQRGGGGIGCFRIGVHPEGYSLPDLSRLGIASERLNPMSLSLDPGNLVHVRALAWLAGRYAKSPATTRAYLHNGDLTQGNLAKLMESSLPILEENLKRSIEPKSRVRERLAQAIENYQQLFGQAYHPLICDWIDFGLYSVRVHIRLTRSGPVLESLYARLFPVEFTHQTIGTVGVDSIANHEGEGMEFNRYAPLVPQLVDLVGGTDVLCDKIKNSFYAFQRFVDFLPTKERERMPVRAGFDISPLSGLIPEGNADPVRGYCANTRWSSMYTNTSEWAEDALAYYSWKSQTE